MSWYDYRCNFCGHIEIDIQRSIKENVENMECPECGKLMKQIIGNSIFKLKGSCWASDGYNSQKTKVKNAS